MTYKEVLDEQKNILPGEIKWWPQFLYHFTDVHNASRILYDGWIYSRQQVVDKSVMANDNASRAVIEATDIENKCYGRLYFRPLTPTQYHNEGYKPKEIRNVDINASCPVPIFLCLNANATLGFQGTKFAEKGIAGSRHDILEGADAFSKLNFPKIYHKGPYSADNSDIKAYRQSEVIREGGFPIEPLLSCILCRTPAERETLLFLLNQYSARLYNTYKEKVLYIPSLPCFYNNGIFIKRLKVSNDSLDIFFNDPELRQKKNSVSELRMKISVEVVYKNLDGSVLNVNAGQGYLDYNNVRSCSMALKTDLKCDVIRVTVRFDDSVMYENELSLNNELF